MEKKKGALSPATGCSAPVYVAVGQMSHAGAQREVCTGSSVFLKGAIKKNPICLILCACRRLGVCICIYSAGIFQLCWPNSAFSYG